MYTVLAEALARAKERSGAADTDNAYLTEILTLSAGTAAGTTYYRPFYCAAKWLEQNLSAQTLKKAREGVEFTGLAKPIESLLALQAAYDKALGLTIPEGFEAVALDCLECPTSANSTTQRYYGSTSRPTTLRP